MIPAHVLDHAEDRDADLFAHRHALVDVVRGNRLGRRDDDGAGDAHVLRQRDGHVAGAWGQVEDEKVELAPEHVFQELREGYMQHRAAPDHGALGVLEQEADRHAFDAEALEREDVCAVAYGAAGDAEHGRDRRAVDVGVQQADAVVLARECEREVGGHGALAHAGAARSTTFFTAGIGSSGPMGRATPSASLMGRGLNHNRTGRDALRRSAELVFGSGLRALYPFFGT